MSKKPTGRTAPKAPSRNAMEGRTPARPSTAGPLRGHPSGANAAARPAPMWTGNSERLRDTRNGERIGMGAADQLGPSYNDPFGGATLEDLIFGALNGNQNPNGPGGGGRGGGGGGGGGGSAGPSAEQLAGLEAAYATMLGGVDAKGAALNAGFDAAQNGYNAQHAAGAQRTAQLIGQTTASRDQAQAASSAAYAGGDAALQKLLGDYTQMAAARLQPANKTLGMFGAGAGAVSDPSGMQDLLTAQRANVTRQGTNDNVLYANRANVYNGLNQDVTSQQNAGLDTLTQGLIRDRQLASAATAQEKADLTAQQQLAILQLGR